MEKQIFHLRDSNIRRYCIEAIQRLPLNPDSPHEIHLKQPKRSKKQNDRMWPMLADISAQVTWYGERLTDEDWKDLLTVLWLQESGRARRSAPGIGGGVVFFGVRTRDLRKAEMTELIEIMFWFGAEKGVNWSEESKREIELARRFGDRSAA